MKLHELTIHGARELLLKGDISAKELTQAIIDRVAEVDNTVKAYVSLTPEIALKSAGEADERLSLYRHGKSDSVPPLLGIPAAIKDVICTQGVHTTCGSRMLENFVPPYDATVMEKLKAQGLVLLGKTNMDEFAMGSSTENSAFFTTRNPWDTDRVPGGSSGGSAAAVSADECLYALGSDTGGSIRQPAGLCGMVGMKPTYGRVSRYGLVAFASSLDQIGPLTKDVHDCALVLSAISGYDASDSTSLDVPVPDFEGALMTDLEGLRVGVPREYMVEGIDADVEKAVREALSVIEGLGATVGEVSLPHTDYAVPTYYIIAPAEASANLARYDGVKYGLSDREGADMWESYRRTRQRGFGAEVKRRIMLGTYALSAGYYDAYYVKAQKVRTLIRQDFDRAFEEWDVLAMPVSPTPAFRIGEKSDDPLQMYLSDIFTISLNLAGLPGMSVPCGLSDGLPVGLQLIGKALDEAMLLRVGYAYEQATDWHSRKPSL
jgi:aspartyl-tRNA(Asn)/glutamyl-tRNA(Gln) amidotransferase subunit A